MFVSISYEKLSLVLNRDEAIAILNNMEGDPNNDTTEELYEALQEMHQCNPNGHTTSQLHADTLKGISEVTT